MQIIKKTTKLINSQKFQHCFFTNQTVSVCRLQQHLAASATFCSEPWANPWTFGDIERVLKACPDGYLIHWDLRWRKEACFRNAVPPFEKCNKLCLRNAMSPNGIRIVWLLLIVGQHCVPLRKGPTPPTKKNALIKIVFGVDHSKKENDRIHATWHLDFADLVVLSIEYSRDEFRTLRQETNVRAFGGKSHRIPPKSHVKKSKNNVISGESPWQETAGNPGKKMHRENPFG